MDLNKIRQLAEKRIAEIDSELKRLDAVIDTQSTALAEKQEQVADRKSVV